MVATGEEAEGFLRKFGRASRRDLCEEGGVLYEQWKKYADLENEKTIAFVGGVMGLAGQPLTSAAIAVTVIMLHLGVKTMCEEYGKKAGEGGEIRAIGGPLAPNSGGIGVWKRFN